MIVAINKVTHSLLNFSEGPGNFYQHRSTTGRINSAEVPGIHVVTDQNIAV